MNNAGLPGTGLGGLFYLLLALAMPVVELVRAVRGRGDAARRRLAWAQFALAVAIIASVALTVVVLARLLGSSATGAAVKGPWLVGGPLLAVGLLALVAVTLRVWAALSPVTPAPGAAAPPAHVGD